MISEEHAAELAECAEGHDVPRESRFRSIMYQSANTSVPHAMTFSNSRSKLVREGHQRDHPSRTGPRYCRGYAASFDAKAYGVGENVHLIKTVHVSHVGRVRSG